MFLIALWLRLRRRRVALQALLLHVVSVKACHTSAAQATDASRSVINALGDKNELTPIDFVSNEAPVRALLMRRCLLGRLTRRWSRNRQKSEAGRVDV